MKKYLSQNFVAIVMGLALGITFLPFTLPAVEDMGQALYDYVRPVVTDWQVTERDDAGGDVVLSGSMVKRRDCLFLPPTLARDITGRNFTVVSGSPSAGRTWDSNPRPQLWGPWRIEGGEGKSFAFINAYLCNHSNPTIVELGVSGPLKAAKGSP